MTISSWLNFGRPASPGRGSAAGWEFSAAPYYSQRAVCVSLSAFFILAVTMSGSRAAAPDANVCTLLLCTCALVFSLRLCQHGCFCNILLHSIATSQRPVCSRLCCSINEWTKTVVHQFTSLLPLHMRADCSNCRQRVDWNKYYRGFRQCWDLKICTSLFTFSHFGV